MGNTKTRPCECSRPAQSNLCRVDTSKMKRSKCFLHMLKELSAVHHRKARSKDMILGGEKCISIQPYGVIGDWRSVTYPKYCNNVLARVRKISRPYE